MQWLSNFVKPTNPYGILIALVKPLNLLLNDRSSLEYIRQFISTKTEISLQNEMNQKVNNTVYI